MAPIFSALGEKFGEFEIPLAGMPCLCSWCDAPKGRTAAPRETTREQTIMPRGLRMTVERGKAAGVTRRAVLRGAAAATGLAAGSGAITGFPTIWAQNIKDVVLHHAGPPVTAIPRIAEQATKDLGFTVHMQTVGERRSAEPLPVAVERDRLRRCQHRVPAISGRAQHPAGHPGRQGQGLGPDDSAVHQGRLSRRPGGLEAGRGALYGGLRRRCRTARSSPPSRPSG